MKCPKCSSPMEKVSYEAVEVDRCTGCKGLWFDLLEHERLKNLQGSEVIDIGDPEVGRKMNKIDKIDCPVCRTRMTRMVDKDQHHIWYEACATCYGLFFDAGEFKDYKEHSILDFFKDLLSEERK